MRKMSGLRVEAEPRKLLLEPPQGDRQTRSWFYPMPQTSRARAREPKRICRSHRKSVNRDHYVASLDDRIRVLTFGELQFVHCLVCNCRCHDLSADIDLDVCRCSSLPYVDDFPLENVTRT